jgi:hypothetical protein
MTIYRFSVDKLYAVESVTYEEAVDLINSEREYQYVVDESWQLLSTEEVSA